MSTSSAQRQSILDLLTNAYPAAVSPLDLEAITTRYQARVHELGNEGWQIETVSDLHHGRAGYRLVSLTQTSPDQVVAGIVLRIGTRSGVQVRTHQDARKHGAIPAEVLERAQGAAMAAYLAVIDEYLPPEEQKGMDLLEFLCGIDCE